MLEKRQLLQCKQFYQCIIPDEISSPELFSELKQDPLPSQNPALKRERQKMKERHCRALPHPDQQ